MKYSFSEIKEAYIEISYFLEYASGLKVNNLDTKIVKDLGIWGDENFFMLNEYSEKYKIGFSQFNYSEYFVSEAYMFRIQDLLFGVLFFPINLTNSLFKTLFPKYETSLLDYILPKVEEKKDLTFGDLIASKLKGEFCLRAFANIQLLK